MKKDKNVQHDEETVEAVEDIEVLDHEAPSTIDEETDDSSEATEVDEEKVALKEENEALKEKMLRLQAEYDNFRKRTQKEKAADLKYKSQELATSLVTVVDNFDRALQVKPDEATVNSFYSGMEIVYRQMLQALTEAGVEEIKTEGEMFDPNLHQAVMQVEDDQFESQAIVDTLQKGYRLKDRVIRPAMVKVNQ